MSADEHDPRRFGPKTADHPSCNNPDSTCPACGEMFQAGDFTTLVTIGPGTDEEEQQKAREGRAYNAIAVEAHYACVTGVAP